MIKDSSIASQVFMGTDLTQTFSWLKMTSGYDAMLSFIECGFHYLANTYQCINLCLEF